MGKAKRAHDLLLCGKMLLLPKIQRVGMQRYAPLCPPYNAAAAYRAAAVKIDFGIIPWMPLVPSTTWVT